MSRHLRYESSSLEGPHPRIHYRYTVLRQHCSLTGFLSGGCVAALFDDVTSTAVYMLGRGDGDGDGGKKPGGWFLTAVSRVLSVTYLRPCRLGDELRVEAVRVAPLPPSSSSTSEFRALGAAARSRCQVHCV